MSEKEEYFKIIVDMAREIADKMGEPIYEDGMYEEEYIGKKYRKNDLFVTLYNNKNVEIEKSGFEVLFYVDSTKKIECNDGEWTEEIKSIYKTIPDFLHDKEIAIKENTTKVKELESLKDYFTNYVKIYNKKDETLDTLNEKLNESNIVVKKEETKAPMSSIERYFGNEKYYKFVVYYEGNKVMEFKDNENNSLPELSIQSHINDLCKKYVRGNWTDTFRQEMDYINDIDIQKR